MLSTPIGGRGTAGAAVGAARGHRRPPLGRPDLRADCRARRLLREHGSSPVPCGPVGPERTPGGPMSNEPGRSRAECDRGGLGSLEPARSRIDRDLVMFRAGQASVRPSRMGRRAWNAIAASLALVALGEGVLLAHRPPPQVVEEVVVVREPAPGPSRSFRPSSKAWPRCRSRSRAKVPSRSGRRLTSGRSRRCCVTGSMACPLRRGSRRPIRGRGRLPPARCCKKNSADFSILETPHETNDCLAPPGGRPVAVGRLGPAAARPAADGDHSASGRRAGPGSQIPARARANQARAGQRRDLLSSRCHHHGGDLLVAQGQGESAAGRLPRLA